MKNERLQSARDRADTCRLCAGGLVGILVFAQSAAACSGSDDGSSDDAAASSSSGSLSSGAATSSSGSAAPACAASADTAANTTAVVAAAGALLAALTPEQQSTLQLARTAANAEQWSNLPTDFIPRNGVRIGDMSDSAQAAAVALVDAASGAQGATLFSELRAADEWLVSDGHASPSSYGRGLYYFSFHGTPSNDSPWMLQVAGHHLAYNFTYNGACTSATPLFDGSEPMDWKDSAGVTHAPVAAQRAASTAVVQAIAGAQGSMLSGTFTDVVNGPTNANQKGDSRYPNLLTYPVGASGRGVVVGTLDETTQGLVKTAIEAWVKNVAAPVSTALLTEYESSAALADTYVAYAGSTDLSTKNSYFRIDGPRVWIEVTVQGGIIYHDIVHFHTVWRDKAADYGAEYIDALAVDAGGGGVGMGGRGDGGPPGGGGPQADGGFAGPGP